METGQEITTAKRKRLLKTFGACPAGYTHDDLERFLDLLYGMFSDVYTMTELRQIVVSDPFDRSEHPRQLKLVELTDWLEAGGACDGHPLLPAGRGSATAFPPTVQRATTLLSTAKRRWGPGTLLFVYS